MIKKIISLFLIITYSTTGCIEPYYFELEKSSLPLVIESYISNVSYDRSIQYPSDGHYFITKLRYGQNLLNEGQNVTDAQVALLSKNDESWNYTDVSPGEYWLLDKNFQAEIGKSYKLKVTLENGEIFESDWETLYINVEEMNEVSFIENERVKIRYSNRGKDKSLIEIKGIELTADIPLNTSSGKKFYMWQYEPTWIYLAGRVDLRSPYYRCWIRGKSFLSQYTIHEDNVGGYTKSLAFIEVETNERVYNDLSILVRQFIISKDYYNFLKELNEQGQSNNIFTAPPFNLKTNYHSVNSEKQLFGYFSVRHEEARRMYFSVKDLSYYVNSKTGIEVCKSAIGPYDPEDPCDNCLNYNAGGEPINIKPSWWH